MSSPLPAVCRRRGRRADLRGGAVRTGLLNLPGFPGLLGLLGLLALWGCEGGGTGGPPPGTPRDCAALSDSLFPDSLSTGVAVFRVVEPNGGRFKVGSRMTVVVAGADYTSALVDLVVSGAGGGVVRVPGFPLNGSIDPRVQCEFAFAVPESAATESGRRISLVSDSVKVRVSDYHDRLSFDYSDSLLAIIP